MRLRRGSLQRLCRELKLLRGNVRLTANTLPFVGEVHSFGGYNSKQRSFRGEDGDNVCSSFELSVNAFHDVGRSEPSLYHGWAINDGKAFITLATLRVETHCRYISAIARLSALSIREALSNSGMMGVKEVCVFRVGIRS